MNGSKVVNQSYRMLKVTYGVVPIVAGLDKFTGLLADWPAYLSPIATDLLPISAGVFMKIVGLIEIAAGALVLTRLTRIGAWIVSAWLVGIAVNLLTTGQYLDVAVRDLVMAVGAVTLARLSTVVQPNVAAESAVTSPQLARAG